MQYYPFALIILFKYTKQIHTVEKKNTHTHIHTKHQKKKPKCKRSKQTNNKQTNKQT